MVSCTNQSCNLYVNHNGSKGLVFIVYAKYTVMERRTLWEDLFAFRKSMNYPYRVVDDFNIVFLSDECMGWYLSIIDQ